MVSRHRNKNLTKAIAFLQVNLQHEYGVSAACYHKHQYNKSRKEYWIFKSYLVQASNDLRRQKNSIVKKNPKHFILNWQFL